MISVSSVYDTILDLIRKDQHGHAFNITEFNNIIDVVNKELYTTLTKQIGKDVEVMEDLKEFVTPNTGTSLTNGVGNLPSDYDRILGEPWYTSGTDEIPIDIVDYAEFTWRRGDELTKPTLANPIAFIVGVSGVNRQIYVWPASGITTIKFNYLTAPTTPFLDYYVDEDAEYTYLAEGATSISLPSGAEYRDGTLGPGTISTSQTVDLEWEAEKMPTIVAMVLQKAGIILEKQLPVQYGVAREVKETD